MCRSPCLSLATLLNKCAQLPCNCPLVRLQHPIVQLREISILETTFLEGLTPAWHSDPDELVGKLTNVTDVATVQADAPDDEVYEDIVRAVQGAR